MKFEFSCHRLAALSVIILSCVLITSARAIADDCNGNGVDDLQDINPADPDGNGEVSADCNGNQIPDECEIEGMLGVPVFYVDAAATGAADGSNWVDAFIHVKDALAAAATCAIPVEIRVAQGTYMADGGRIPANGSHILGSGNRNDTITLADNVTLLGGYRGAYDGSGMSPDDRDNFSDLSAPLFPTILSGDLVDNDAPSFANYGENAYHVVTGHNLATGATIDGFTLRGGSALLSGGTGSAAGLDVNDAPMTLRNLVMAKNQSNGSGAGVLIQDSTTCSFENCLIEDNKTIQTGTGVGAGCAVIATVLSVSNCTVRNNVAAAAGGAMLIQDSQFAIDASTFDANHAFERAGAIRLLGTCSGTIDGSHFLNNENNTGGGGGALWLEGGDVDVTNTQFIANKANAGSGGAAHLIGAFNYHFTNCVMDRNTATVRSGALHVIDSSNVVLTDCQFTANDSHLGGAAELYNGGSLSATNCDFIGNTANEDVGGAIVLRGTSGPVQLENCRFVQNSAITGGAAIHQRDGGGACAIDECAFVCNSSAADGGAVWLGGNQANSVQSCYFVGNIAADDGGAILVQNSLTTLDIVDSLMAGNIATSVADGVGGAISTSTATLNATNCTIVDNLAGQQGGGIHVAGPTSKDVRNSVIWNNHATTTPSTSQLGDAGTGPLTVTFTDVEDGISGTGNVNADPLFADAPAGTWTAVAVYDPASSQTTLYDAAADYAVDELAGELILPNTSQIRQSMIVSNTATEIVVWGDFSAAGAIGANYQIKRYSVKPSSPVVDAGNNTLVPAGVTTDLAGDDRFIDDPCQADTGVGTAPIVDMGAYEFSREAANLPPIADAGGPYTVLICDDLQLDASASVEPDSPCGDSFASVTWDIDGDGQFDDATGLQPLLTYADLLAINPTPNQQTTIAVRIEDTYGDFTIDQATLFFRNPRIYVNQAATGANTGESWANAYVDLQDALTEVRNSNGCGEVIEIWVAAGSYSPGETLQDYYAIASNERLIGGFSGSESSLEERDLQANITELRRASYPGSAAILKNDNASTNVFLQDLRFFGTSVQLDNSSVDIRECTFDNSSFGFNGSVAKIHASRFLSFVSNALSNSDIQYVSCRFSNSALIGNAFRVNSSTVALFNCTLTDRYKVEYNGSLIDVYSNSSMRIVGTTIAGNITGTLASVSSDSSLFIDNSILWNNYFASDLSSDCPYSYSGSLAFLVCGSGPGTTIRNSIIEGWDPAATSALGIVSQDVIGSNPRFVDADGADNTYGTDDDDLRLLSISPAIDRGDNTLVDPAITTDLAGNPRFVDIPDVPDGGVGPGPIVDIGAYEFQTEDPSVCAGGLCIGDLNGDYHVDGLDIAIMVDRLLNNSGTCP